MSRQRKPKADNKRGASSRQRNSELGQKLAALFQLLVRGGMLAGLVAALAGGGYFVKGLVEQAADRPIRSIGVEGQFVHLSQQEISGMVTPMIVGGFLQSPLPAIKRKLEAHPWVASAAVSRRWPDELFISISEEQPIARWGDKGFLNHRGEIIEVATTPLLESLPLLAGDSAQSKRIMQNYQQLAQTLAPQGLKISEFYSDELLSWHVVLGNGLQIVIGRDQAMEKVQRFLVVYKRELSKKLDQVAAVDLRYGNGLAVQWKAATAESAEAAEDGDNNA